LGDNIHAGHRERLKSEFLNGGFNENTPEHKWLELLLFYCIPQCDTNPLAHQLIEKYKTIRGVLDAPAEELIKFKGLTKNNIPLLKIIIPIARQCEISSSKHLSGALAPENVGEFILKQFYGLTTERLGVACLDAVGKIIKFEFIGYGDTSEVTISARSIVRLAVKEDAVCVVIAHNHPKSFALPSKADVDATAQLSETLNKVGIKLLDHLIISGNDYVSLAQSKDYQSIFI